MVPRTNPLGSSHAPTDDPTASALAREEARFVLDQLQPRILDRWPHIAFHWHITRDQGVIIRWVDGPTYSTIADLVASLPHHAAAVTLSRKLSTPLRNAVIADAERTYRISVPRISTGGLDWPQINALRIQVGDTSHELADLLHQLFDDAGESPQ